MSATADDVAATTATAPQVADANEELSPGAESAPAVTDSDEDTRKAIAPVQERINELTRRRYDAERDRDYWREQAMRSQPREEARPEPAADPAVADKTLADFSYDESAFRKYLFAEATKVAAKAARDELTRERSAVSASERDARFGDREAEFAKGVPDYFEVTRGSVPITNEMAETIKESDFGPAIAFHLGKNPQIAAQIARLTPLQQAREIGRLEAKLSAKPVAPQVSAAPPPAPKIAAANPQVEKDPKDMSDAEFAKWRKRQIAQRH